MREFASQEIRSLREQLHRQEIRTGKQPVGSANPNPTPIYSQPTFPVTQPANPYYPDGRVPDIFLTQGPKPKLGHLEYFEGRLKSTILTTVKGSEEVATDLGISTRMVCDYGISLPP